MKYVTAITLAISDSAYSPTQVFKQAMDTLRVATVLAAHRRLRYVDAQTLITATENLIETLEDK